MDVETVFLLATSITTVVPFVILYVFWKDMSFVKLRVEDSVLDLLKIIIVNETGFRNHRGRLHIRHFPQSTIT